MSGVVRLVRGSGPCLAAAVLAVSYALAAGAQTPDVSSAPGNAQRAPAIEYRRVFVPADREDAWPTSGARYLPIERGEFERLVLQAEERKQLSDAGGAQIIAAEYSAMLTDSGVLQGTARLDVQLIDESPCVVPLDPWNTIITGARWESDSEEAATIGLWTSDGRPPHHGVLAPRSGRLLVDWQTPADPRVDAKWEYVLQIPSAVAQRIELDLANGCTPTISTGRLVGQSEPDSSGRRRWSFQLSGGAEHRLEINRPSGAALLEQAALPLLAMSEAYSVAPHGVDYEAELRLLGRRAEPLTALRVAMPGDLHVANILVNRLPATWNRDPEDASQLLITLPATEGPTTVTITGAATAVFDAPWTLPCVIPEGVFWTEGTSTIWVDPTLEVRSMTPRECSLLNLVGIGSGNAGEVYRIQAWSKQSAVELVIGNRKNQLQSRSGVGVEFADREIFASFRAVAWTTEGRLFHISMPLGPEWVVESVEALPADSLVEWHVEEGASRRLHLQLRRSPTEPEPLSINLAARKPWRGWARTATVGELDLLRLPGRSDGHWLMVKDRRGSAAIPDAKLADAMIPLESITPDQQELLGEPVGGLALDLSRVDRSWTVSLLATAARFSGEGWMAVSAVGGGFEHRAELQCRPTAGAVSDLRVFAARPLPAEARWEIVGDTAPVVVESTPIAAASVGTPGHWTEYRLRLPRPRNASFRIRAAWRGLGSDEAVVNTLTLPDAETWQAWAILRGQPRQVGVDAQNVAPTPAAPRWRGGGELPILGSFRLSDDPSALPEAPPAITSVAPNAGDAFDVVGWQCDASTRQFADGHQIHRIEYQLESRHSAVVELQLPSDATLTILGASLIADGHAIDVNPTKDSRRLQIHLPGSDEIQTLRVEMESKNQSLGGRFTIEPVLLRTSFQVIRGRWRLEWPAEYRTRVSKSSSSNSWLHRLAGPLAAEGGQRWYDGMLLAHVNAAPQETDSTGRSASLPGGWASLSQSYVDAPASVEVVRSSSAQALWHVAWLVSTVIGGWLWLRWPKAIASVSVAAALACLTVPIGWHEIPQAIFLGTLTGVLVRQAFRWFRGDAGKASGLAPSTAGLALVFAMIGSLPGAAQEATTSRPLPVLFPVDVQGKSIGADVYVPTPLAAELLPASPLNLPDEAALVEARYQLELAPAPTTGGVLCTRAALTIRWESYRPNAHIELPLARDDGQWDAASFQLNGQPFAPAWNADGTSLSIVLGRPGKHEFSATLAPLAETEGQRGCVRLHVPKMNGALVEIAHPAELEGVQASGASRPIEPLNASRTMLRLGAVDILDVSWPARFRADSAGAAVEQLSVLELDPAVSRLDVRLRFSGAPTLDVIRLSISPQLKLLPLPEGSLLEAMPIDPRRPEIVELRFRSPPALPITVPLQFQMQRTLSAGRIDYPSVDVLGMTVRRRHFVVNGDRRLRLREEATTGLTAVSVAELDQTWGMSFGAPTLQYAVASDAPTWSVEVAPIAPRFTPREALEVRCEEKSSQFTYEAAITDIDGEILVHRLVVPPDLQIDRVTATVEGAEGKEPLRWARARGDRIEIFLSRPLSEPHHLHVEAHQNYAATKSSEGVAADAGLPVERRLLIQPVGLESSLGTPMNVAVYRESNILVDWRGTPPSLRANSPLTNRGRWRFVGEFPLSRSASPPELAMRTNEVQFRADTLLTLELDLVEPLAKCRLQGQVTRGVLDSMRIVVGKNWRGPFACEPMGQVFRRDIPGDAVNQLIEVQLARSIPTGEEFSLSISGPVSLESDQQIRFPLLRVVTAQRPRGYLILPPSVDNQTAEWTLRGLEPETLPPKLAAGLTLPKGPRTFRVGHARYVAEQRVFPDAMRSAAYRIVESRVAVDADGQAVAASQFVVQAGGGGDVQVQLPHGAKLLYAAVDGTPLAQVKCHEGIWQAPTGPRYLPRVFLLSYQLPASKDDKLVRLSPPQVSVDGKILVPRTTLWQIADRNSAFASTPDATALTPEQFAVATRRGQIEALIDSNSLASQLHEWEAAQWRQPWLDRLYAGDAALAAQDSPAWTRLLERLTTSPHSAESGRSVDLSTCWSGFPGEEIGYFQGDVDGGLTLVRQVPPWEATRWFAAVALAGVVGAAWRYPSAMQSLAAPVRRWPHAVAIVAGLLWWLLLTPSLLGVVIVSLALAGHAKSAAPRTNRLARPYS